MPANPDPIADAVFDIRPGGAPVLLAGRDRQTGRMVFPLPSDDTRFERHDLPTVGTLWSFTIQRFRPKSPPYAGPEAFEPYAVGYVALGEQIIVESRLTGIAFNDLRIGMALCLVTERFVLGSGETRLTYAFASEVPA